MWRDQENIDFGNNWFEEFQNAISVSSSVLIFIKGKPDTYQREEINIALRSEIENLAVKVIPILLPGSSPEDIKALPLLQERKWVDLRNGLLNVKHLNRLIQAIRGERIVPIYAEQIEGLHDTSLPSGYQADVRKIIQLLIGESLYARRDVCIRETIQNSVDACERRRDSNLDCEPRIIVRLDEAGKFFEVDDNGDGMSPFILSESFSIIGKSIRHEQKIIERTSGSEIDRLHLIAKFGIGFISSYILADRIYVSTRAEGDSQINFEIADISDNFIYHAASLCEREESRVGTTVRIYLKEEYIDGDNKVDLLEAVQTYCRHVPYIQVHSGKREIELLRTWNTAQSKRVSVTRKPRLYEMHLSISKEKTGFIASNSGFLIRKDSEEIMPKYMPTIVSGEISVYPGVLDLNISRDNIVPNNLSAKIANSIAQDIKILISREVENLAVDTANYTHLLELLMFFVSISDEYDKEKQPRNLPLLNPVESTEYLVDVWRVWMGGNEMTFRQALEVTKASEDTIVYFHSISYDGSLEVVQKILKDSLFARGILVIESRYKRIVCTGNTSFDVNEEMVLKVLQRKYEFELLPVSSPRQKDIASLTIPKAKLSRRLQSLISKIEKAKKTSIIVLSLDKAPAAFTLRRQLYLNSESNEFKQLNSTSSDHTDSVVEAYILGLLQLEL